MQTMNRLPSKDGDGDSVTAVLVMVLVMVLVIMAVIGTSDLKNFRSKKNQFFQVPLKWRGRNLGFEPFKPNHLDSFFMPFKYPPLLMRGV